MGVTKTKWTLAFFICIIFITTTSAQYNSNTDSLLQILQITNDNRDRARLLLRISKEEEVKKPEYSFSLAQQALKIAQIADFDSAEIKAMIQMGIIQCWLNKIGEAFETGEQVVQKASKYDMPMEVADGRSIMAVAYSKGGDFDNSSRLYFENLDLYERLNNKFLMGSTLGNIGADFLEQHSYQKALEYTNKALRIGLETKNLTLVTDQYNNLAAIYQVGFNDYANAMANYSKALQVAQEIEDFQQQGGIMLNIGRIYMKREKSDSAFYYLEQSLSIFQKLNNPVLKADCFTAFGDYYFKLGDYSKGKEFALSSLSIANENGILQTISDATYLLHKISLIEKDTSSAYKYHIMLTKTKDSLYVLQNQKELFKLEFKYNQERISREQKIKQQRYYIIFGFIILILLSGLFITILFNSRQKIKIKNTNLEKEKAESDLRFKSKELSINLLALLKKNDLITEVSQRLTELEKVTARTDTNEAVVKLNREIKQSSDDRLWQEFSIQFKETNSNFYDKLLKKYPDLSHNEMKLCAYLRLNMSTKEISDLTGQRTETLEKARYRLRKKFDLTSKDNLVTFLSQI